MNFTLFIIILCLLQLVCLLVGKRSSKGLQNQQDYFLAGKAVRFFPLMMTFVATQVGGGLVLGSAEEAFRFGWVVLLYPLGQVLGFVLLACGIGKRLAQFQVSTVAQLFEVVYQSSFLKRIASLLSIISLFMILVAQVIASQKFMISLGLNNDWLFIAFWGIVVIYTVLGGLKAVVSIDIVQAIFFLGIFAIGFGYILSLENVSFFHLVSSMGSNETIETISSKWSSWLLMPLLFMVIEQDMAQRCFAARSPAVVSRAAGYAALCTLSVSLIPIYIGVLGKTLGIEVPNGSSVFITIVKTVTNPVITALIGCAVLAVIISTAVSLINAVGSNLTQDFSLFNTGNEKGVRLSRLVTAGIGTGSIFFSYYFDNVVNLLIQSYELSVCCLFIPIFAALFKKQGNLISAGLSISFGTIGFLFFHLVSVDFPKEIASIFLSLAGYCAGEAIVWLWPRVQAEIVETR